MLVTFLSLINMTISGSLMILLLYLLARNNHTLLQLGTKLISAGIVLTILRLFFPFEFSFTRIVNVTKIFPDIYSFLIKDRFYLGETGISIQTVFYALWILVSSALLMKSLLTYIRFKRLAASYRPMEDPDILGLVKEITVRYNRSCRFRIVVSAEISTPMIFGLTRPYIILPDVKLEPEDWHFILAHEISHYCQGHLYFKLIYELLCDLYWWNPVIYILKKPFHNLLEMSVDRKVTEPLEDLEKLDYLQCLTKMSKLGIKMTSAKEIKNAFTFSSHNPALITRRSHILLENMELDKKKNLIAVIGFLVVYLVILLGPFFYIVQPRTNVPETSEKYYTFDEPGCFIIENKDGTCDLYADFQYMSTITNTLSDVSNIRTYTSLEEALVYEKN